MPRRTNKQVSFDIDGSPTMLLKQGGSGNGRTRSGPRKRVVVGIFMFGLVKSSRFLPAKGLLRRVGAKVASAFRFESIIRRSSSYKVSSSNLHRSRSLVESIDSHRAEAIEDCIEFLNSSSSLLRSNSVSACSC
ncbi:uncharacterized protein LOC120217158 [Hibiscus syriacus]|uniref:uncharacterized protein LOC120217158 n=1 Tax=Hibiscus syriacus TaxID=106335 RepID=UPI00192193B8|nr:uncharacterized protein LOC120217158 [Hibiscus syriacus]